MGGAARGAMPSGLALRSPAPLRVKPFASRGQISSGRLLAWPFLGGALAEGAWKLLITIGSVAAALINCGAVCGTVAPGAVDGVSAPGWRARLRLTT
jgi:hypothetical protein